MPGSANIFAGAVKSSGQVSFGEIRTAYNVAAAAAGASTLPNAISIDSMRGGNNFDLAGNAMIPASGAVLISVALGDEPTSNGTNSGSSSAFVVCHLSSKGAKTWTGQTWGLPAEDY